MHAALLQTWHAFHPGLLCFQVRMDGSDGQSDLRMSMPQNVGAFYRESTKPDGSALCQLTCRWQGCQSAADSMHYVKRIPVSKCLHQMKDVNMKLKCCQ